MLVGGFLAKSNQRLTLILVVRNSLLILVLYGTLSGWLFGLGSGAAVVTVVGVLIELPLILTFFGYYRKTSHWFTGRSAQSGAEK